MPARLFRLRSSFSRDFFALAAAVAFLLILLSIWIGYKTYQDHQSNLLTQMAATATRLDRTLTLDVEQGSYLLESISRQILAMPSPPPKADIARLLRSFDTEGTVFNLFSWIDSHQRVVATSHAGVLKQPMDVTDRDYIKKSLVEPWKVHIGRPVEGRISGQWIVPLAMGVHNERGEFMGAVLASIHLEHLSDQLRTALDGTTVDYGIVTRHYIPVLEASEQLDFISHYFPLSLLAKRGKAKETTGRFPQFRTKKQPSMLTYYHRSAQSPFVFLLGMETSGQYPAFLHLLWQRLLPLLVIAAFAAFAVIVIRNRVIQPLAVLGEESERLLRGDALHLHLKGPSEITFLGRQMQHLSAYMQERRRVEYEQKAKLTFLKRAKDTAELSNRVKLDFLTSMSHEFRIPLNTLSGFVELMKNEVYGPIGNDRYRQYVADMYDALQGLQSLVGDVISLTKAESAQAESQEKPIELQLVVARAIRQMAEKLKEAGITVENRVREDIPRLRVDEARLRQIIQNLLLNALSHTPSGGSVVVDARMTEDKLHQPMFELIITDYGAKRLPGRRDDELGDATPRAARKLSGQRPGNLGVPLTRALVAMQQATLEVESPPGKATTVTVRYPKEKIVL